MDGSLLHSPVPHPSASPVGAAILTQAPITSCLLPGLAASALISPNNSPFYSQDRLLRNVIQVWPLSFSVVLFFLSGNLHSPPESHSWLGFWILLQQHYILTQELVTPAMLWWRFCAEVKPFLSSGSLFKMCPIPGMFFCFFLHS